MFSKAQFNGALRTIQSSDAKLREAVTGAVSFVVFNYVAHSKNTTPREQMLEATQGIKWLHSALSTELSMGSMPKPDKAFTAEQADTWAAFAVSRMWETQQAKRDAAKATREERKVRTKVTPPPAPDAGGDPLNPVTVEGEFHVVSEELVATDVVDVHGPLLIGEDGTTMELSQDEYKAVMGLLIKMRMTALKVA